MPDLNRKRRHHYVWQFYLRAWSTDGQVSCLRDDRIFRTDTKNVGLEKDFYELADLSPAEVAFIRRFCVSQANPILRNLGEGWLPMFLGANLLEQVRERLGTLTPETEALIKAALSNTHEDLHCAIESRGIPFVESLRKGDLTFLQDIDARGAFLHFLCVQYFRTAKIRDSLLEAMSVAADLRADHMWGVMSHIYATNVAYGLFSRWPSTRVELLTSDADNQFLASDQPVINLAAAPTGIPTERMILHWPVSPSSSLRWDAEAGAHSVGVRTVGKDEVTSLNNSLADQSESYLFATTDKLLVPYLTMTP